MLAVRWYGRSREEAVMKKVLVVEDDFLIAQDLRLTLESFGW
jgi:hypothetical protein